MQLKQRSLDADTLARTETHGSQYEGSDRLPTADPPGRSSRPALRLGERLAAEGWVTPEQIEAALEVKRRTGGFLGETMLEMGFLTAAQLGAVLAEIYGVAYVDLGATTIEPEAGALVPQEVAGQT